MSFSITDFLKKMKFGEIQSFQNVSVFPLFSSLEERTSYITLSQALESNSIHIGEIDHGGSVPELIVENSSDKPVLLLDGEELQGAKQNRVLNTTVLVKEHSKVVIPVSCTEQGRWDYNSNHFSDSGVVMARSARLKKNMSVSDSIRHGDAFRSDQGEVWYEIHKMSSKRNFQSPTSAMRDVFEHSEKEMDDYMEVFDLQEGQKGMVIGINGKIAGLDHISSAEAFASLHDKLLKSYIMDALVAGKAKVRIVEKEMAEKFLYSIGDATETVHPSVSLGDDHRYESEKLVASALVNKSELIHLAAFPVEDKRSSRNRNEQYIAGYASRRGFRSSNGSEE